MAITTTKPSSPERRITAVVRSCETQAQTRIAVKYSQLLIRRQPAELQNGLKLVLFQALTDPNSN